MFTTINIPKDLVPSIIKGLEGRLKELELEIKISEEKIKAFETKYGFTTDVFLQKYSSGELGDEEDYISWYGEVKFLEKAREEYNKLTKVIQDIYRELSQGD